MLSLCRAEICPRLLGASGSLFRSPLEQMRATRMSRTKWNGFFVSAVMAATIIVYNANSRSTMVDPSYMDAPVSTSRALGARRRRFVSAEHCEVRADPEEEADPRRAPHIPSAVQTPLPWPASRRPPARHGLRAPRAGAP